MKRSKAALTGGAAKGRLLSFMANGWKSFCCQLGRLGAEDNDLPAVPVRQGGQLGSH